MLPTAKVFVLDKAIDVQLRNLSQNGALLETEQPPAIDTEVVFERGGTKIKGRVAWSFGARFGVEFLTSIEESEVLIHVGRPKWSTMRASVLR